MTPNTIVASESIAETNWFFKTNNLGGVSERSLQAAAVLAMYKELKRQRDDLDSIARAVGLMNRSLTHQLVLLRSSSRPKKRGRKAAGR